MSQGLLNKACFFTTKTARNFPTDSNYSQLPSRGNAMPPQCKRKSAKKHIMWRWCATFCRNVKLNVCDLDKHLLITARCSGLLINTSSECVLYGYLCIYTHCHIQIVKQVSTECITEKQLRDVYAFCQRNWTRVITHVSSVFFRTWGAAHTVRWGIGCSNWLDFMSNLLFQNVPPCLGPGPISLLIFTHPPTHTPTDTDTHTQIGTWRRINTSLNKKTQHNAVDPAGPRNWPWSMPDGQRLDTAGLHNHTHTRTHTHTHTHTRTHTYTQITKCTHILCKTLKLK